MNINAVLGMATAGVISLVAGLYVKKRIKKEVEIIDNVTSPEETKPIRRINEDERSSIPRESRIEEHKHDGEPKRVQTNTGTEFKGDEELNRLPDNRDEDFEQTVEPDSITIPDVEPIN